MPRANGRSEVRLSGDITSSDQPAAATDPSGDQPFVIVILGDFSGAAGGAPPGQAGQLADRPWLEIDRDNLDDVLARLEVHWQGILEGLPGQADANMPVQLVLHAFDDFHPDRIAEQLAPLRSLVEIRRALEDPRRFEGVAAEMMRAAQQTTADASSGPALEPSDLVSRIVDQSDTRLGAASSRAWSHDLQRFLANVVAPYLIKIDTPRQAALIDAVDQALAEQLRAILHHPQFQQLEAAWRGLRWLVHTAETGTLLKLRLIQVTKDELKQDLAANPTRTESGLAHLLLDPASIPGTEPVALLLGTYEFTQASDDVALLRHLGMIAQQLRAPFVAAAGPRLVGCSSFAEIRSAKDVRRRFQDPSFREWHDLRRSPEAHWIALALPRFLLRLPYGTALEPVETFQFEELVTDDDHDRLLWGNPAFAVAAVAAGAFAREGWSIDLSRRVHRLEGLPLYIYEIEGTATTKPCAEVLLSERLVEALQEAGLVPVVSYRDSDMVALPCIQSLAEPRSLLP